MARLVCTILARPERGIATPDSERTSQPDPEQPGLIPHHRPIPILLTMKTTLHPASRQVQVGIAVSSGG